MKMKTLVGILKRLKTQHTLCLSIVIKNLLSKVSKFTTAMEEDLTLFCSWSKLVITNIYSYGFCIMDNKYDSFAFKVKLNVAFEEEIKSFE